MNYYKQNTIAKLRTIESDVVNTLKPQNSDHQGDWPLGSCTVVMWSVHVRGVAV